MHRQFIHGIYKKDRIDLKNTERMQFISDRLMFITPVNIYLDFCFSDTKDFNMVACLSKIKSHKKYLLFDQRGFLNGI